MVDNNYRTKKTKNKKMYDKINTENNVRCTYTEKCKWINKTFGTDRFNRVVGVTIKLYTIEYKADDTKYLLAVPGLYWGYQTQSTRDGKSYGASQKSNEFKTEKERDEAVAKYLKSKTKRESKR